MLLALELEDSIVGYAMQDNEIPAQYKAAFDSLHCITQDWSVSKEMILALEPDFLMFWNGSADYDYEFLNSNGISTYRSDAIARVVVAPSELPIGIVTAFIGAPFFLVLLRRSRYSFQ